jgi:hypothetical protein
MKPLTITIHDHRKVFAIREEFSRAFPDLKLEFHARPHTSDGPASPKLVRDSSTEIRDCRTFSHDGTMTIRLEMTIGELQDYFRQTFGLEVEIYSRTGADWEPADFLASLDALSNAGQDAIPSNRHYSD